MIIKTLADARKILSPLGLVLRANDEGEIRVSYKGGAESTAYYTDDVVDAVTTGIDMAKRAIKADNRLG